MASALKELVEGEVVTSKAPRSEPSKRLEFKNCIVFREDQLPVRSGGIEFLDRKSCFHEQLADRVGDR